MSTTEEKILKAKTLRQRRVDELQNIHVNIKESIRRGSRRSKVQNFLKDSQYKLEEVIERNDKLIKLLGSNGNNQENVHELELWVIRTKDENGEIVKQAYEYIEKRSEKSVSHVMSSRTSNSTLRSAEIERRSEAIITMKTKELEREAEKRRIAFEAEERQRRLDEETKMDRFREQELRNVAEAQLKEQTLRDKSVRSINLDEFEVGTQSDKSERTREYVVDHPPEKLAEIVAAEAISSSASFSTPGYQSYPEKSVSIDQNPVNIYLKANTSVVSPSGLQQPSMTSSSNVELDQCHCISSGSTRNNLSNSLPQSSFNTFSSQSNQLRMSQWQPSNLPSQPMSVVTQSQYLSVPYTSGGAVYYQTPPFQPMVPIHETDEDRDHRRVSDAEVFQRRSSNSLANKPVTIQDLAEIFANSRKDPLPEWKLSQFDGNPLSWHEWYGQFCSTVDSTNMSDDIKLNYLKTLVTGKAKDAISEFAYCGRMYKSALNALKRKYGQPHTVVAAHLEKLSVFPPVKIHNSDNIISFASVISNLVAVFRSLSYEADLRSVTLLNQVLSKLPANLKESWAMHTIKRHFDQPSLIDFNEWIREKAEAHERMRELSGKPKFEDQQKTKAVTKIFATNSSSSKPPLSFCPHGKGKHPLWKCITFKEMNPTQRIKFCAESNLCFSCFQEGCVYRKCPRARKCSVAECKSTHNSLLHGADRVFPRKENKYKENKNKPTSNAAPAITTEIEKEELALPTSSSAVSITNTRGLLQVVELDVESSVAKTQTLVLCDNGSSHSWVSRDLANRLKLSGRNIELTLKGINSHEIITTQEVEIKAIARFDNIEYRFQVSAYVKERIDIGSDTIDVPALQQKYPHLQPIKSKVYSYSNIEMILGQDSFASIKPLEYFVGKDKNTPVAVRLPIGWVLSGPISSSTCLASSCFKSYVEETSLAEQVKTWYELESYGAYKQVDARSADDKRALEILQSTTFNDGKRYLVGMLWAEDNSKLPNNYYFALSQLKSLEKRFTKDSQLKERYAKTISEDLEKGYVKIIPKEELRRRDDREWYLPHHPVLNPNKPGKVRRVLNGASKFQGKSLNQALLVGPDLLRNLIFVLMRFRQYKYAVSADIEGMFLQVGVLPKDQPSLRFVWREDPSEEVHVYQYTRHIFGAKDSPTCANFALQQTARDNLSEFPEAAAAVLNKFYMDDYLDSFQDPEKALTLSLNLVKMLRKGGFKLTKFISNVPGLCAKVEPENKEKESIKIIGEAETSSHVLGLKWDHKADTLVVSRGVDRQVKDEITQRSILSLVSSVFDPIGLVAPYTVRARLLLKDIWRIKGQSWDEPIPLELENRFKDWQLDLPTLGQFTIPRSYFDTTVDNIELHMFGDSSLDVFCAVAFLRARSVVTQETKIAFVFGKARVAPMKALTIPKLELQAALLASRLKIDILNALTLKIDRVFMWTDSTTVIQWLSSLNKLPMFVANRVAEILESTTVDQWFHVATDDNPADIGTRGISADSLRESSWLKGPPFLLTKDWPFKPKVEVINNLRTKAINKPVDLESESLNFAVSAKTREIVIDWIKYSSFEKLLRITAYVLRMCPRFKHFRNTHGNITDPSELYGAELKLISICQKETFQSELRVLTEGKPVPKASRIATYSPFLGPNKVIRATGRVKRLSNIDFDAKHPIILDGRHPFVKLFLRYQHEKYHHQSIDYIRCMLSQQFIILRLRWVLKTIQLNCVSCRSRKARTVAPMMSDLPVERLGFKQQPFANCGVDYFGPLFVSVRRSKEKRWCFLFTCMTTRAVHLEVVHSLDTSSCVMGIERFISRRGTPSQIWSDNGTNFVGASKELVLCFEAWNKVAPELLARKGIKWKFNPPASPHHGGSWERLVRSCKQAFYAILGNRNLSDEILRTCLCLVEQSLNARPLTEVSSSHECLETLTPNHFLLGQHSPSFPSLVYGENFHHKKMYVRAQSYANAIWARWLREYVPTLNKRAKWHAPSEHELKPGELVWIVEVDSPRGYYPLGRILELNYGKDNIARSALVKTATGKYTRPVVKLAPVLASLREEDVNKL